MHKIYLYVMVAQEMINIIFNSYSKYKNFELDEHLMIHFLDYLDNSLVNIDLVLEDEKLYPEDLFPDMIKDRLASEVR